MSRGGFFAVDSLAGMHVLVVEDDAAFREVLVSLLRYCGALVTTNQVKPDVIVVTIGPHGAAVTLARRVRARKPEDGGNAPIVAVVREGAAESVPEGVNAHLSEPLNPWELCRVIS